MEITIPDRYPFEALSISFNTKICHPNISLTGGTLDDFIIEICLDLLTTNWSPAFGIISSLEAIRILMDNPEPDSPLNVDAALLYRCDMVGYQSLVRFYCREHAKCID